jgi:threonine/homoserine/homoserine lactone efflux protein
MTIIEILTLLIFLFPLAFSPGPGNMFFAANGARFGIVKTLSANFGYHLATIIVACLIGLGFNLFFSFIKNYYQYIQILGSLYVIYLAYKFFKADAYNQADKEINCTFVDGVVLLLFNPKAYVIISLMFTMFLNNDQNILKVILISTIFTFNNFISFTLWTLFGDLIGAKFRNEKYSKILNNIFSLMLFLVALWMLTINISF